MIFYEVSAKSGLGINDMFHEFASEIKKVLDFTETNPNEKTIQLNNSNKDPVII